MKRILALTAALLLLFACAAAEGTMESVSDEERVRINAFLTCFSGQGLTDFVPETAGDGALCDFAGWLIRRERPQDVESGGWEYGGEFFSARVSDRLIRDAAEQYTGRRPVRLEPETLFYRRGYYYFSEGAPMDVGFASLSAVQALGGGRYGVTFGCYGQGWGWTREDCALRPEQAAARYPECPAYAGYAVIDMGGGGPGADGSGWRLVSFHVGQPM